MTSEVVKFGSRPTTGSELRSRAAVVLSLLVVALTMSGEVEASDAKAAGAHLQLKLAITGAHIGLRADIC